jgi:arylsulfatase A-like enzyme
MNRRNALKMGFGLASAFSGAARSALGAPSPQGKTPPNVLILMSDQLNASALSCYGGWIPTPHLERLAGKGVIFNNATCTTPFCSPSRASLITGLYPHSHGITYNVNKIDYPAIAARGGSPATERGVTMKDVTTEKLLHEAGYSTHHYGKWHLSDAGGLPYYPDNYGEHIEYAREMEATFQRVRRLPADQWMDWYDWALPVTITPAYRKAAAILWEKWRKAGRPKFSTELISKTGRLDLPVDQVFDYRVAERTVRRLRSLGPNPFMITCSLNWPHDPNVVPSPYYERFDPERINLPANYGQLEARFANENSRQVIADMGDQAESGLRELLRIYAGCVRMVDDQIGRVLDALNQTGRAGNTIVVFAADHGDMAGGHGMFWKNTASFYDEIARVPLIIAGPGSRGPVRAEVAASLVDIMPTLLDLVGHPIPPGVQGASLAPYLTGQGDPASAPAYSFCERVQANPGHTREVAPGTPGSFMVRGKGWKYCTYPDGEEFLYHIAQDPGEMSNLSADPAFKEQKDALRHELEAWLQRTAYPMAKS